MGLGLLEEVTVLLQLFRGFGCFHLQDADQLIQLGLGFIDLLFSWQALIFRLSELL